MLWGRVEPELSWSGGGNFLAASTTRHHKAGGRSGLASEGSAATHRIAGPPILVRCHCGPWSGQDAAHQARWLGGVGDGVHE